MTRFFYLFLLCFLVTAILHYKSVNAESVLQHKEADKYQCLPCGRDCDKDVFEAPGECPDCHMKLVKAATIKFKTVQPEDLCQYIKDHPGIILLDVRTKEEFEGKANPDFGSLKNAINIPIQQLQSRLAELAPYKTKEIIVYCSHSHRSPQATYLLSQNGFSSVTNMAGGMSEMKDKGCVK